MSLPVPKPATLADLLAIPEEERRHELIEGVLDEKGATTAEHGGAQRRIAAVIDPFERRPGGRWPGGWWFGTEVDVYFDEQNTLRPDVSGWRRERVPEMPTGVPVMIRPDWVCEILSTKKTRDLITKKRLYHRHQVPHYWIVDPVEQTLTVYRWSEAAYLELLVAARGERVSPEPFDVIPLQVGVLFGDEPD